VVGFLTVMCYNHVIPLGFAYHPMEKILWLRDLSRRYGQKKGQGMPWPYNSFSKWWSLGSFSGWWI